MKATVNASELLAASKLADNGKNAHRVISGVYVETTVDKYSIVSTDSFSLVVFSRYNEDSLRDRKEEGSVIISANDIKANVKASDATVCVSHEGDGYEVTMDIYSKKGEKRTVTAKPIEGTYPDYKRLFDNIGNDNDSHDVIVNPGFMLDICNAVRKAYGKDARLIMQLNGKISPVYFTCRDDNGMFNALLMPIFR